MGLIAAAWRKQSKACTLQTCDKLILAYRCTSERQFKGRRFCSRRCRGRWQTQNAEADAPWRRCPNCRRSLSRGVHESISQFKDRSYCGAPCFYAFQKKWRNKKKACARTGCKVPVLASNCQYLVAFTRQKYHSVACAKGGVPGAPAPEGWRGKSKACRRVACKRRICASDMKAYSQFVNRAYCGHACFTGDPDRIGAAPKDRKPCARNGCRRFVYRDHGRAKFEAKSACSRRCAGVLKRSSDNMKLCECGCGRAIERNKSSRYGTRRFALGSCRASISYNGLVLTKRQLARIIGISLSGLRTRLRASRGALGARVFAPLQRLRRS